MNKVLDLHSDRKISLDHIISTSELKKRKSKQINYKAEADAYRELATALVESPDQILQKLCEVAVRLCEADSAGVSILEPGERVFRWRAVAGMLQSIAGRTMDRDFSPCGVVLDRECAVLMKNPERYYAYMDELDMPVKEVLLVPFRQNGSVTGTIWIVFHCDREFDSEDLRILSSLALFASAAVQSSEQRESTMSDLTEEVSIRKTLEDTRNEVLNERTNLRNLFRQTPEMVCILRGPEHIFEFVNEAHIRALGFDATGLTVRQAQPESVEVHGILDEVYRTGNTAERRGMPVTVGDRLRYFNLTYAARRNQYGQIDGVMILGTEITEEHEREKELKAAKEEAEQANLLKSAFLANMSHEIRTPLGAMIGFADLLRDPMLSEAERASYIDIMIRNGESLAVIINDILDLSKVEAGHMSLEFSEVNPGKLAAEVVSLMRVKAKEKNLRLELKIEPTTPKTVVTDAVRLKQILTNLVGNAIKFTSSGTIKVKSFGCTSDTGQASLCFEVTDSGMGIAKSEREKIFEMFVQADGSATRRFGGTGLGLALSRRFARALGGDVTITESSPGHGSTFLAQIAHQPERARAKETVKVEERQCSITNEAAMLNGVKVLVVDDAPDNQELIGHYLQKAGAVVDSADNGGAGYSKALSKDYDIVLMDIQMPEMDGYTATHKLREAGYQKPIIALTAHVMSDVRQRCVNVGCTGYLPKPINPKDLIATVAKHAEVVRAP